MNEFENDVKNKKTKVDSPGSPDTQVYDVENLILFLSIKFYTDLECQ